MHLKIYPFGVLVHIAGQNPGPPKRKSGHPFVEASREIQLVTGNPSVKPAPAITTKFISISNGRFGHYDTRQNRAITPREAALLQTFPRNYVFYPEDNLEFTATLIGNAVPPKLAKFFGEYIAQTLE